MLYFEEAVHARKRASSQATAVTTTEPKKKKLAWYLHPGQLSSTTDELTALPFHSIPFHSIPFHSIPVECFVEHSHDLLANPREHAMEQGKVNQP